jgi:Holliday junction resolvase RusA-like endonuclease
VKNSLRFTEEQLRDYQDKWGSAVKANAFPSAVRPGPVQDFLMQQPAAVSAQVYEIVPVPKPRMTQRDKWKPRPRVERYRTFCDQARALEINLPLSGAHIVFVLPMPRSWSKKKRAEYLGRPHQSKPDLDNMIKALADALHKEDSGLWDIHATKIWGDRGEIRITG